MRNLRALWRPHDSSARPPSTYPLRIETSLHNYAKHDILSCPLCGESHICLCNRATECPCASVNLTRDEAEWIGWQTGNECVCIPCLLRLRDEARTVLVAR